MSYAALPVLRTPRLTLRPLVPADADAIVEGVGNYDVSKWLSVVPYPYSREDALWFIDRVAEEAMHVWGICDDSGLIGVGGFDPELGYWLARPSWRKGYGFEAAQAMVDHWFSDPGAPEVVSGYFPGNERSGAVLRALGFENVGSKGREAKALNQEILAADMRLSRTRWGARKTFVISTERLKIRPLAETDADAIIALAVPEVARNTGSFDPEWTRHEVTVYIRDRLWRGLPAGMFAVEENGGFIGVVGVGGAPVSAMYAFHPEVWGRGIATEAMQAFLADIYKRFPVNRIVADHFEDNPASGTVLRKLGFVQTGREVGQSKARLEPAPLITYALTRDGLRVAT